MDQTPEEEFNELAEIDGFEDVEEFAAFEGADEDADTGSGGEGEYRCMLCGQPVLRDGSECYDCRKSRPDFLRTDGDADEQPRGRTALKVGGAALALGIAAFVAGVMDLGSPTIAWTKRAGDDIADLQAVAGNCVVVATVNGAVMAFDEVTGDERWRADLEDTEIHDVQVHAGRVMVSAVDAPLTCLDLRTGHREWRDENGAANGVPNLRRDELLVARDDRLSSLDPATGYELWDYPLEQGSVGQAVTVLDRCAFVTYRDDVAADLLDEAQAGGMLALDLDTQESQWVTQFDAPLVGQPALAGRMIVARTADGRVVGLDTRSGVVVWQKERTVETLVTEEDTILLAAPGSIVALDPRGGRERWTVSHDGGDHIPVIGKSTVFLAGDRGVRAFRLRAGSERWEQRLDADLAGPLTLAARWLFIATATGETIAMRRP
ncbi:MAG: PQQ-binding-like beta-propeller repeat protein [Planctomycetota bacterium]